MWVSAGSSWKIARTLMSYKSEVTNWWSLCDNYQNRWKLIYSACLVWFMAIKHLEGAANQALEAGGKSSLESGGSVSSPSVHIPDTFIRAVEPADHASVCECAFECNSWELSLMKRKIVQERGNTMRGIQLCSCMWVFTCMKMKRIILRRTSRMGWRKRGTFL